MSERHTDPLDAASQLEQETLQRNIDAVRRSAQKRELHPTGRCHWCEEPVGQGLIFCEGEPFEPSDCAHDWQREHDIKKKQYGGRA